ncbi:transmembrane protein 41B isoform X2 [Nomascus leucogenys]|uniref:transmembrane protein 41B isoform X2 n=1 Tax=Nomascus leucogenys TaxID=61853 RepID=UPI00122D900D|nr:transmembrane protein 41B isoform X2 [Nomascus leucogenys]
MAKGRVPERSQMGAHHTTPVGDGAAGTRGPAVPGSGDHQKEKSWAEAGSARMSLLILVSIFLSAAFVMFLVYKNFPQLSEEERVNMKVPRDMDDAKALGKVLSKYKDTFYVQVLVAYFATYIFYQLANIRYSRLYISQYTLRVSLSLSTSLISCLFVFWTWCLFLLYAFLFSWETSCIQIPNRESSKMVTAG